MLFVILLFFLSASCSRRNSAFLLEQNLSCKGKYRSSKLTYPTKNHLTGLELELDKNISGLYCYINVFSRSVPPFKEDSQKSLVTIKKSKKIINFIVYRMEGGQRLQFSSEQSKILMDFLQEEKEFIILLQGYEEKINPQKFKEFFKALYRA